MICDFPTTVPTNDKYLLSNVSESLHEFRGPLTIFLSQIKVYNDRMVKMSPYDSRVMSSRFIPNLC